MSCKFSRNTACTGKLRKLESLSPEDTEILLSEHGFLRSSITVQFEICDHQWQYTTNSGTMHKPKRRTGEDGLIVESVVFRPQLLPTTYKGTSTTGNRTITPEILERIHSTTGLVVPIGSRKHILIFQLKLIFRVFSLSKGPTI